MTVGGRFFEGFPHQKQLPSSVQRRVKGKHREQASTWCLHNATSWHRHVNSGTEARAELMWMFPWTFFSTTQDIFRLSSLTTSLLLGMSAVARRHKYGKVIGSHWECVVAIFYLKMFLNVSRMFGA